MKAIFLIAFFASVTASAAFPDNANNRKIEKCRASVAKFLKGYPFDYGTGGSLQGVNAGTHCRFTYWNQSELQNGVEVQNGFSLLTYIDGHPYFSSMEVNKDRVPDTTRVHTVMHRCDVAASTIQIETTWSDPYNGSRDERAVLEKDNVGRLSVRVATPLGDQTCSIAR